MTIVDAQPYRYCLSLTEPLSAGDRVLTARRGLLLRVDGEGGTTGWGEAAPLPGFSTERLEEAVSEGGRLSQELSDMTLPESSVDEMLRALPLGDAPPSVQFAVETAVVDLLAALRDTAVVRVLNGEAETIRVNALIPDATENLKAEAQRIQQEGYQAVKLKVGQRSVKADAARVRTLRVALPDDVSLRLDANRAWTVEEAEAFARAVGDLPIEYVEEPLRDPAGLADLVAATGLPVALDETTREREPEALPDDLPIRAVVLKPTLLGGLTPARRWARSATRRGAVPVISASYESGIGMRMLCALAAAFSDAPAGLSTYTRLETDVLRPRLPLDRADVSLEQMYSSAVDRSILSPVGSDQ